MKSDTTLVSTAHKMIKTVSRKDGFIYKTAKKAVLLRREYNFRKTENYPELKKFKDIHKGKRCFIVGNGPSLNPKDLDRIKSEICFASNYIYRIYRDTDWRPYYYFNSDQNGLSGMLQEKEFYQIGARMHFFQWKPVLPKIENYQHLEFPKPSLQFCLWPVEKQISFSQDVSERVFDSNTITYIMLQFAIYMGFSEIYLLGIDHSFSSGSRNGLSVNSDAVVNHFYTGKQGKSDVLHMPYDYDSVEQSYYISRLQAESKGITIRNATRGGKLEIFERVSFDSLFC